MHNLNIDFFDRFKELDRLCRDIYGESENNKLGVTLYREDMDRNAYCGKNIRFKNGCLTAPA